MAQGGKKSGMHRFARAILLSLNFLVALSLLLSYLASYISPEKCWPIAFFGISYPLLLIANLFFILLWLLSWRKYILISLAAVFLGISPLLSTMQFRATRAEKRVPGSFKVMSFNVHSLYGISAQKNYRGMRSRVTDFIEKENPDILCVQEFYVRTADSAKIIEKFAKTIGTPYFFCKNYFDVRNSHKINALAIFSRYPILSVGTFRLNGHKAFGIYADMIINGDTTRVFNLHLESIRFGNDDYSFYSQLKEAETEQYTITEGSWKILSKLRKAFPVRARQAGIIADAVKKSPFPVIVCGDFNDTPTSYAYHVMTRDLNDSFREAGSGLFGPTYSGNFPSFRIDYILVNDYFEALSYKRHVNDLSDHYPVSVILKPIR
jgi:endonuclease/exonuclease/phosphatase family metal-dependent hydrolase